MGEVTMMTYASKGSLLRVHNIDESLRFQDISAMAHG